MIKIKFFKLIWFLILKKFEILISIWIKGYNSKPFFFCTKIGQDLSPVDL